jgi:outer membrane protein assembly factor BamB
VPANDSNVFARKASTGALLWSYAIVNQGVFSSPVVANGVVYVGSHFGSPNVFALNASTGALLWSYDPHQNVYSSPAVANGVIYFAVGGPNQVVSASASATWSSASQSRDAAASIRELSHCCKRHCPYRTEPSGLTTTFGSNITDCKKSVRGQLF